MHILGIGRGLRITGFSSRATGWSRLACSKTRHRE